MQKETRNILLTAIGAFITGIVTTFLILWVAIALTRPCPCKDAMHKMHPGMPGIEHGIKLPPHRHHGQRGFHHHPRPMPEVLEVEENDDIEEIKEIEDIGVGIEVED